MLVTKFSEDINGIYFFNDPNRKIDACLISKNLQHYKILLLESKEKNFPILVDDIVIDLKTEEARIKIFARICLDVDGICEKSPKYEKFLHKKR